jgi:hypothetical protein
MPGHHDDAKFPRLFPREDPWVRDGGIVNAGGSPGVLKKTENIVYMGRWDHSKDRLRERVEDRHDLGSGERTEGAYVTRGPGRKFLTSGEDRRGDLIS